MLQSFLKTYYNLSQSTISVVGDINQDDFSIFEEFLASTNKYNSTLRQSKSEENLYRKTDAKQSAIIIGKLFPNLTSRLLQTKNIKYHLIFWVRL